MIRPVLCGGIGILVVCMLLLAGCSPFSADMANQAVKTLLKSDCRGCQASEGEGETPGEGEGEVLPEGEGEMPGEGEGEHEGEIVEEGEVIHYTLTYLAGTGGSVTGTTPQPVAQGANGSEVTAVPGTGYHFVQWSDGVLTTSRTDENITADLTVTAQFAVNVYTITCTATGSGTCTANPVSVPHGSTSLITITSNAHWHIATLQDSVEGAKSGSYTTIPVTSDRTITAVFEIDRFTLTYGAGAGGTISGLNFQYVSYSHDGSSVTAVANKGYHFLKWSDGRRDNPRMDEDITADLSVTAIFSSNAKTLSLPDGATMDLVWIRPGSFQMGRYAGELSSDPTEDPQHEVTLNYGFWMGKYEVTQRQWLAICHSWPGESPTAENGVGDNYPAYYVSWQDAKGFNTLLTEHVAETEQGQLIFRLPSEAEWEYACRAGTTTRFYFGDSPECIGGCSDCAAGTLPGNLSDYMWYCDNNTPRGSKPVGGKLPNPFGLNDMSGNLWEWCEDRNHDDYVGAPRDGSAWVTGGISGLRMLRGGYWDGYPRYSRSANRTYAEPDDRLAAFGFRVVAGE